MVAISVAYTLLVSTFCSVDIWNINVGVTLGVVAILCCAKVYGIVGSGICGILTTCGMLLFNSDLGFATIFFAIGGLACGIVTEQHKTVSGVFFLCINVVGLMLIGDMNLFALVMGGILMGSILYFSIPSRFFKLDNNAIVLPYTIPDTSFLNTIEARLKYSVQSIKDVRLSALGIANAIDKKFKPLDVTQEVYNQVCAKCRNRSFCWDKNPQKTKASFETLKSRDCENISITDMPEFFNWCFKRTEIAEAFVKNTQRKDLIISHEKKSKEDREVLYSQIALAENIITSAMHNIVVRYIPKVQVTEDVSMYLRDSHIPYLSVSSYLNDLAKLTIEVYIRDESLEFVNLEQPLSDIAKRDMEFLTITLIDDFYRVTFCEKKSYAMEVATAQRVSKGCAVCGDTADHYTDCYGNQFAILSDGMGNGNNASIDSQLAVRLFRKLTLSGLDTPNALEVLNSLLMTKSCEESFATLDILKLDVYSGTADIYKAGATSTIIKVGNDVKLIEGVSYPLGIMEDVTLFNYKFNLSVGDVVVMLSDGVDESLYQYIKTVLLLEKCNDIELLAQSFCETALQNHRPPSDDITITVVKIV
jgi:stage II sporulation protein E